MKKYRRNLMLVLALVASGIASPHQVAGDDTAVLSQHRDVPITPVLLQGVR